MLPTPAPATTLDRPALTKIVATLGPASDTDEVVTRLALAGASVFRLNFSHGAEADHGARVERVRRVSRAVDRPLAVLGDLCGPKIRIGRAPAPAGIMLTKGQEVVLAPARGPDDVCEDGPVPTLVCTYERIGGDVLPGDRALINDGAVRLLALENIETARGASVRCAVTFGGPVMTGKGVNLPDSEVSAPAVTKNDERWARWALAQGVDYFALSFVRSGRDVLLLRAFLESAQASPGTGGGTPIIAKIEKPQAVERIDEILDVADGIMIARGDLGVEMDIARAPIAQKRLLARAQAHGKPCIVATQMLESMIERAGPTRAEASDVANGVLDGADALMLSGETAVGAHPALVVDMMRRIALAAEEELRARGAWRLAPSLLVETRDVPAAIAHAAQTLCEDLRADLVVVWSEGGGTARRLSQNGLPVPVLAFSSSEAAVRRMCLLRGVAPVCWSELPRHRSEFARLADRFAIERGWVAPGQTMVLVGGKPFGVVGTANTVAARIAGAMRDGGDE